jgi:hypothetical protein
MLMPNASMVDRNLELDEDPFVNKTIITPDMSLVTVPTEEVMIRTWL